MATVIVAKKYYLSATTALATTQLSQIFKVSHHLLTPKSEPLLSCELTVRWHAFARFFASKLIQIHSDQNATRKIALANEIPSASSGLNIDHFDLVTMMDTDRILGSVKATACVLGLCPPGC